MVKFPSLSELSKGVLARDRTVLARAITLIESQKEDHQLLAQELLKKVMPHTGKAKRIGVTGVPGVGKSTFLDSFGMYLIERGARVAVLAVDPSSSISGGSILGDKSRMNRLAMDDSAFIRPTPSGKQLGGVAHRTRESILLCEAAGFDVIFVETVGVGQNETLVSEMVDFFLVLMLAGAGDELQGIKKGILEIADLIAINKSDQDNVQNALHAQNEYNKALHYLRVAEGDWSPKAISISALESKGYEDLEALIDEYCSVKIKSGLWENKRIEQNLKWMRALVDESVLETFYSKLNVDLVKKLERKVQSGLITPKAAAKTLINENS